jgi:cell division transport system permease protein
VTGAPFGVLREGPADRVMPRAPGVAAPLGLATVVLTFLGALVIALALTGARFGAEFGDPETQSATLQIMADGETIESEARAALDVLRRTEGVLGVRVMEIAEQRALLEPWLGPNAAVQDLPLPLMIEVTTDPSRLDVAGLEVRLAADAPHAIFDDHGALRGEIAGAARGLRIFSIAVCGALLAAFAAVVALACRAEILGSISALRTLRLVGARDSWISGIFARRIVRRVFSASVAGTAAGLMLLALLPSPNRAGFYLASVALGSAGWVLPCLIPALCASVGWIAAQISLRRAIRRWS